jgi:capsular polysaccharide biosynthesis protein
MEKYFDNRNLIRLIIKWKYHIATLVVLAGVLSAVFSSAWFITPLFKSFAIVYPANITPYSEESETEQMLQLLQSRDIKDSIIHKFDLAKHYEVDSSYKYFYTTLLYEYEQRVNIKKTPYESLEIEVMDKDPEMAADIVDAILEFYNQKVRKIHTDKYVEVVDIYYSQLKRKQIYIDSLRGIMKSLGVNYGLYEYESQSEEITKGFLGTVNGSAGTRINKKEVDILNQNMKEKSGDLITTVELLRQEARTYADIKLDYEQALRFVTDRLTYANIITPPFPADKKSYPVRWLIVAFSIIATFFMSLILILIIENYHVFMNYKSNEENQNQKETPSRK